MVTGSVEGYCVLHIRHIPSLSFKADTAFMHNLRNNVMDLWGINFVLLHLGMWKLMEKG